MHISGNEIGNEGARHLADALKKNHVKQSFLLAFHTLVILLNIDTDNIKSDDKQD